VRWVTGITAGTELKGNEAVGMKLSSRRARALGIAVAASAAIAAFAAVGTGLAATTGPASSSVVLVNCGAAQVKPSAFTLACADGGAGLTKLRWVSWKDGEAFATGTEYIKDCYPSCVSNGTFYTYPVLITVWRAAARPGHRGQDYFTRMTIIHTGRLSRPHGKLPLTQTYDLSPTL
jgi:hypothetical protein